jgi:CheY-like chemotaxis protein/HPt (histidine-containing phosphotransfer) domain-containing protein
LLANAVKFTPAGGVVQLRAMPLLENVQGVRLEVQDTGPGIPPEKRHLLFEDFSQLFQVPGEEGSGTGLGLAISARLAALMGGRIGCEDAQPIGALFWVDLPLREVALADGAGIAPLPAGKAGEDAGRAFRVLVADDVAANRMVARAMLVAAGHRVDSAADGAEALSAVEREAYDVVLMDVQMPVMDGLEAARRIRALDGARGRTPILAVTASALPDQVAACREAGMDGHLPKPIDRESLLAAVRRLATGGAVVAPPPAPHEPADAQLLDPGALASLTADLGPTAEVVIGEFVSEVRLGMAALSAEGVEADIAALRDAAHRLLGAARTLGARRLAGTVEALQEALRAERDPARPLRHVLDVAAATLPALDARLPPAERADRTSEEPASLAAQGIAD